jgi:hypothetical protein
MEIFNERDQQLNDHIQMQRRARWMMLGFTVLAVGFPFVTSFLTRGYVNAVNIHISFWMLIVAFIFINALSMVWPLTGFITFGVITAALMIFMAIVTIFWFNQAGFDIGTRYYLALFAILAAMTLYMKSVILQTYRFRKNEE